MALEIVLTKETCTPGRRVVCSKYCKGRSITYARTKTIATVIDLWKSGSGILGAKVTWDNGEGDSHQLEFDELALYQDPVVNEIKEELNKLEEQLL